MYAFNISGPEDYERSGGAGWEADPDSGFLRPVSRCYEEELGRRPRVY